MSSLDARIAEIIIKGFRRHYRLFMESTAQAKFFFEQAHWVAAKKSRSARIAYYDQRVEETLTIVRRKHPQTTPEKKLWQRIKALYTEYLLFHPQAELAETFYNSVFCNLFSWPYYHNAYIFVNSTLNKDTLPSPTETVYSRYFPSQHGLKTTILAILKSFNFTNTFANLNRDIRLLIQHFIAHSHHGRHPLHKIRLDVINSIFYRNKAAYIVGRVVSPTGQQAFVIPLLQINNTLYIDTIILNDRMLSIIFGFYRAYFMVHTETPSALVYFLKELMPAKELADLYAIIGLHKQGKTEFYRNLLACLKPRNQRFIEAPGIAGMVMFVFTLPNFPYVFKIIRDRFGANKDMSPDEVKFRYYLVKKHDRVGRMADILEYSNVALPLNRFNPDLLKRMTQELNKTVFIQGDQLIIKHLYIERKMIPLNLYLDKVDKKEQKIMIREYGQAIKDMLGVNIFPGDMLFKNFGVTPYKRVVFYDYDEVEYLTNMNFKTIPPAQTYEQEMSREPWYSVAPNDFFPEEILTFVTTNQYFRKCLQELHPQLLQASYWKAKQISVEQGEIEDIFPYPQNIRFKNKYPEER